VTLREAWDDVQDQLIAGTDAEVADIDEGDLLTADRLLRAIYRIEHDRDDYIEVAAAEMDELRVGIEDAKTNAQAQLDRLYATLERFHRAVLEKHPNRLSIKLPSGTLTSTAQQPEWEWEGDGAVFRDWCRANDHSDLLTVPQLPDPKVKVADAKAALTLPIVDADGKEIGREYGKFVDGTEPPGVKITDRGRKFTPKPKPRT
jgi:hypothetical protein